jgi:hypothetical protein
VSEIEDDPNGGFDLDETGPCMGGHTTSERRDDEAGLAIRHDARRVLTPSLRLVHTCPRCDGEEDHVHRFRVPCARGHEGLTCCDTPTRRGDITFRVIRR